MTDRTNPDSDIIRHNQERDRAESEADAERSRASIVGTRGLGGIMAEKEKSETEKALERATRDRGAGRR